MPVGQLNNAVTQDNYADALTVLFAIPRQAFTMNVSNKAIFYRLAVVGKSASSRDVSWEINEHQLVPSLSAFRDPSQEGFPPGSRFIGVQVRSAAVGIPASVTVI